MSKCPVYTKYLPTKSKVWLVSFYNQPFLRYNVATNQKFTKWVQNDMKHLTVKSILHAVSLYPQGPNFGLFHSIKTSYFQDTMLLKIRIMHWLTSDWPWTLNGQKYAVYGKHLTARPKFWSVSLYGQPFLRYTIAENWNKRTRGLGALLGHLIARQEKVKFKCLLGMKRLGK